MLRQSHPIQKYNFLLMNWMKPMTHLTNILIKRRIHKMRMGDNMSMNLETGELHITSGWNDNADEDDFWYILFSWSYYRLKIQCNNFGGNNLANIENCKECTACTDTVASQAVLCWKRGVPVRAHLFFKGGALLCQIHFQTSFHGIHRFLHTRLPV